MANITLSPTLPEASTPQYPELPPEPRGSWLAQNRKSAILGGIVVLLVAVIGITTWIQQRPARVENQNSVTNEVVTGNTNTQTGSATNRVTFRRYEATVTPDDDGDGLSNDEERQAGSNAGVKDSDGDGISDYDEVKVYQSNPTKKDSDGDGVADGQEVSAGTNPNGPGSLLDLQKAIQQLSNTNQ